MTSIEQLNPGLEGIGRYEYGWADPTRRQLAERAQTAGVTLRPVIEVEDMEAALQLSQRGLGDTVVARATLRDRRGARSLHVTPFADPMWEAFAFIGAANKYLADNVPWKLAKEAILMIFPPPCGSMTIGSIPNTHLWCGCGQPCRC